MGSGKKNQILTEKPYDSFWATVNEKVNSRQQLTPTFGGFGVKRMICQTVFENARAQADSLKKTVFALFSYEQTV